VGLEWGPLSFASTNKELLGRKISLKSREYGRMDPCTNHATPSIHKSVLTTQQPLSIKVGTNFADKWRSLRRYSELKATEFVCLYV
jgi:hypothetical protein